MNYQVVDFRKPTKLPDDISQLYGSWQNRARAALESRWGRHLPFPLSVRIQGAVPVTGAELRRFDESSVCSRLSLGEKEQTTVVVVARTVALGLVAGMLGEPIDEAPVDRSMTDIERSFFDFLVAEFQLAMQETQPLSPTLKITCNGQERLKDLHREFPERESNVDVVFGIQLPFGNHELHWVFPQSATLEVVSRAASRSASARDRENLEMSVRSVPGELVVRLGSTMLHVAKLANLREGDLIVLDQRITDTLTATIGGFAAFRGWAGKTGNKQAFQVETILEG